MDTSGGTKRPRIYNTLTRRTEPFVPRTPWRVKLFTCGPSVYRRQHLGNYRTYLFEDVLQKYLTYLGMTVERAVNFTDVEDKALSEARARGVTLAQLQRPVEQAFFVDCDRLGIELPPRIYRSSECTASAVDLIERLLDRGHAYRHDGDFFFDPLTYEGFGRLFGLDMTRWPARKRRFRKDTYPGQRWNRGDFILWHKPSTESFDVSWKTRLGPGRPAWNIQDAAIIHEHLGDEIDLHTGGVDNLYRHHDYTLAVMEGAGAVPFCPCWMHGGHLLKDGVKMSKSRDNVCFLDDLTALGFTPRDVRLFLLYGAYRESLDLRVDALDERSGYRERVLRAVDALIRAPDRNIGVRGSDIARALRADFEERMNDDLDVKGAFDAVASRLIDAATFRGGAGLRTGDRSDLAACLREIDGVLGVLGSAEGFGALGRAAYPRQAKAQRA